MRTGNIGFFEIHVDDFQRAQKFYHDVFGWEFSKSGGVPYEFYMIDSSSQGAMGLKEGGMRKREETLIKGSSASGFLCHIIVEAIDEALEKIVQHGGEVTSPKGNVPAGYFAYALDTEGNPFAVWEIAE